MAETFNNLYSVGPGSLGPGTHVTKSVLDPQTNRGTITRIHKDDNGISTAQLAGLYTLSDNQFPGTSILLRSTYVRQITDKLALIVSRYGGSSGTNFKTVMTRTPSGYRQAKHYSIKEAYTKNPANYVGHQSQGILRPDTTLTFPLLAISWSNVVYQDIKPTDHNSLIGKINSNSYSIDGYGHAPQTLKFAGTRVRHEEWGGYSRYVLHRTAYYDPRGRWRTGGVNRKTKRTDGTETWTFELANGGDGIATYDESDLVNFPSMP